MISGTTYVTVPPGASAIKFEDPRLPMMMPAPPRLKDASPDRQMLNYVTPAVADVLLWESWFHHEVLLNMGDEERISISFDHNRT